MCVFDFVGRESHHRRKILSLWVVFNILFLWVVVWKEMEEVAVGGQFAEMVAGASSLGGDSGNGLEGGGEYDGYLGILLLRFGFSCIVNTLPKNI